MISALGIYLGLTWTRTSTVHILLMGASTYEYRGPSGKIVKDELSGKRDVVELSRLMTSRLFPKNWTVKCHLVNSGVIDRNRILTEIDSKLVKPASSGDQIVFWWSGHGLKLNASGEESIAAIVPPHVERNVLGQILPSSLVFGRELAAKFDGLEKAGVNCTWFLDSCYSGDAARNEGRGFPLDVEPLKSFAIPQGLEKGPQKSMQVSAGDSSSGVREVEFHGAKLGPLTAMMCQLMSSDRLEQGKSILTGRTLEAYLRSTATEMDIPNVPEIFGNKDRDVFSGEVLPFSWEFPVSLPRAETPVWLENLKTFENLEPDLPTIPAGMMEGLKIGDEVEIIQAGRTYRFRISKIFLGVSQLSPVENCPTIVPGSLAKVIPSGLPRLFLSASLKLPDGNAILNESSSYQMTFGRLDATHELNDNKGKMELRRIRGDLLESFDREKALPESLSKVLAAERIRGLRSIESSTVQIESQFVKVEASQADGKTGVFVAQSVEQVPWAVPQTPKKSDFFTYRFKVRSTIQNKPRKVYFGLLYVDPAHNVQSLSSPRIRGCYVNLPENGFSEWVYLTKQGEPQYDPLADLKNLLVSWSDPPYYDSKQVVFALIVAEKPVELSSYLSTGDRRGSITPIQYAVSTVGSVSK